MKLALQLEIRNASLPVLPCHLDVSSQWGLSGAVGMQMEALHAVGFMYMRPPGYNAESARAAEIADERRMLGLDAPPTLLKIQALSLLLLRGISVNPNISCCRVCQRSSRRFLFLVVLTNGLSTVNIRRL